MKLQIKASYPEGLAPLGKKEFNSNNRLNRVIIMKEKWYLFN